MVNFKLLCSITRRLICLPGLFLLCLPVQATVTPVAWWRLGENDPGAINAATATATTNLLGGVMNLAGGPTYTTNVSSAATSADGSTLALKFPGSTNHGTNALFANLTNNFGLELWVNPAANSATACLAYNGNSGGNGWGLYILGGQFKGLFGLVASFGSAPATLNTWTHLALVRNNGTNTVYVNGVANVTNTVSPNLPSGIFAVGAQAQSLTTEFLNGALDEVRVFTFAPGSFTTNDLLLNQSLVVSTNADGGPGSLRTVVANAPAGATITFAPNLSGQTILLTNGQIALATNVTIDGSTLASKVQVNGNAQDTVFTVNSGVTATLISLVITNGKALNFGGGIYNLGTLTLNGCILADNHSDNGYGNGGGIESEGSGTLTLNDCTLANNLATYNGGGIYLYSGTMFLNRCILFKNSGVFGGGIRVGDTATAFLNNCTFANNYATDYGGAIINYTTALAINNCTVVNNNDGNNSGGIANFGTMRLTNSIVSLNASGDIYEAGSTFSSSNLVGVANINLAPLGYYGGPTMTMPPLPGSPAIDAGNDSVTGSLTTDQRGVPRDVGAHVDVGAVEFQVTPASFQVVNTNNDATAGFDVGGVSLRKALLYATTNDVITFAPNLSGQTLLLTNGQITLAQNVTIDGSALASPVRLNGNARSRLFYVNPGVTTTLNDLIITNGYSVGDSGGGIYNNGTLTLNQCTLAGNTVNYFISGGGGIYNNAGTLTMNLCTLTGNSAFYYGGGIINDNSGIMTLNLCTLTGNSANLYGGGLLNQSASTLTVNQCTLANNSANVYGGGFFLIDGTANVKNSTFAGNTSQNGSGISVGTSLGTLTLNNCTVVSNSITTGNGGGLDNEGGTINLTNSIISLNPGGDLTNTGSLYGSSNLVSVANINLAPLSYYGGPTMTMPPLPGSPAIDAGNDSVTGSLTTDQRGFPRKVGAHVDVGAVEVQVAFAGNPPVLGNAAWSATGGGGGTFQFSFTNSAAADFTVLTATNVALPLTNWTVLGNALQPLPGQYQFTDAAATNSPQQFYRVISP